MQELISPKIVQQIPKPKQPELEPFPFKAEPVKGGTKRGGPPPPSPSKFVKGEFRGSDYESDYDSRIVPVWKGENRAYKPVRPVLTPSGRRPCSTAGRTPTPPTEFDLPPKLEGPSRPKFEPIAPAPTSRHSVKLDEILQSMDRSQTLIKPKAKHAEVPLKPGSPPEIAFAPAFPKAVETSNVMSFQESTETSRRVLNLQQTTRLISFGKDAKEDRSKIPLRRKLENDYDSELEGMRFRESPFRKVALRPTSVPVGISQSSHQQASTKSSFISTSRETDTLLQPGEPPEFGFAQIPVQAAASCKFADHSSVSYFLLI